MIVTRAPLSISFAGDRATGEVAEEQLSGSVICAAINRYVQVRAAQPHDGHVRLTSADTHARAIYRRGQRPAVSGRLADVAAVVEHFWDDGIRERGIEVSVHSSAEPGIGLDTVSAAMVALVGAVGELCGQRMPQTQIAELASRLLTERLRRTIHRQEPYASALGGLNVMTLGSTGIQVSRLRVPGVALPELSRWLLLFRSTGPSEAVELAEGSRGEVHPDTTKLQELPSRARAELAEGNLNAFGLLLDEIWQQERASAEAAYAPSVETAYATAKGCGALGGCLVGRGGALLLCCPPESRRYLRVMMDRFGFDELPFTIDVGGVRTSLSAVSAGRPVPTRARVRRN